MSVTPPDHPDADAARSLEEQIEALLREAEELGMAPSTDAAEEFATLDAQLADALTSEPAPADPLPAETASAQDPEDLDPLATQIQRLLDQADAEAHLNDDLPEAPAPFEHDLAGDFIAPAQLLQDEEAASSSAADLPADPDIDQIDEAIANEADRSLAQARTLNQEPPHTPLVAPALAASQRPSEGVVPATAAVRALDPQDLETLFDEDQGATAADVAAELDSQPEHRALEPSARPPTPEPSSQTSQASPWLQRVHLGTRTALVRSESGLRQTCFRLNWPLLRRLDPTMQQTLGYVAGLTAFNGAALLLLNFLLR